MIGIALILAKFLAILGEKGLARRDQQISLVVNAAVGASRGSIPESGDQLAVIAVSRLHSRRFKG